MDEESLEPMTRHELDELAGEQLPDRPATSLINANVAIPVNAAVAANVLASGAHASADGTQHTTISQSN